MTELIQFPHCDDKILHAPEDNCEYCNRHPDWQELRRRWNINFTGHSEPGFDQCPAEKGRPLETIEKWHGNIPMTPEQTQMDEEYWADLNATYANYDWDKDDVVYPPKERTWIQRILGIG